MKGGIYMISVILWALIIGAIAGGIATLLVGIGLRCWLINTVAGIISSVIGGFIINNIERNEVIKVNVYFLFVLIIGGFIMMLNLPEIHSDAGI
jgi:uncharacterized membrane protein YeaQ/YmgE (transglycosylase-associated protein family)